MIKQVQNASTVSNVNNVKVESPAKTTLRACALSVTAGKPMTTKIPTSFSPRLVTPSSSRRRAYRRSYAATPRLTTTDVGLTPRLPYDLVMHTAPVDLSEQSHHIISSTLFALFLLIHCFSHFRSSLIFTPS